MPLIISTIHQKGGVGKTTLTLNLYNWFKQSGLKCGIIDLDVQGSITHLQNTMKDSNIWVDLSLLPVKNVSELADLKDFTEYELILIDTPPYLSVNLESVISKSDFVLIPCKASPLDVLAIEGTIQLLEDIKLNDPDLKAGIVLTMAIQNSTFQEDIRNMLSGYSVPVLKTQIGNRIDYSRSLLIPDGLRGNIKAQQEIERLGQEILSSITQAI